MGKTEVHMKKTLIALVSFSCLVLSNTAGVQQKRPEVPFVPTPEKVVAEMLKIADVGRDDLLIDLGCGDGRIVIAAAKEKGCRGVGIDIDPERIEESRENAKAAGVEDRVEFLLMDLFEADISKATVVTLYLLSDVNIRLRPKLLGELEPGTRVVSHDFDMDEWEPDETIVVDENLPARDAYSIENYWDRHDVYFWVIPANVTGTWEWRMPTVSGKKDYSLKLDQSFQMAEGKALEGSSSIPLDIKDGKIRGDKLEFTLERKVKGRKEQMHFEGFVKNHTMEGLVRIEGNREVSEKWKARRILSTYKPIDK